MSRPTRNDALMQTAVVWSQRSTCSRLRVGAVLSREGRILSVGYNGVPSGFDDCDHTCDCIRDQWKKAGLAHSPAFEPAHQDECRSLQPCNDAIHAEANAIAWAARDGIHTKSSDMHVTHAPCVWCAKFIVNAGILSVRYSEPYRDNSGVKLLNSVGIKCIPYFERMD